MADKLYFIKNNCLEGTTIGVARISNEDFPKFKKMIKNLNRNSTSGVMPTISVYKIDMSYLQEVEYNPHVRFCDDGYTDEDYIFFEGKTYILAEGHRFLFAKDHLKCVIKGR